MTVRMKRFLLAALAAVLFAGVEVQAQARYGSLRFDSILHAMPEYATARAQLSTMRQKYEAEASYNEQNFRRLFAEYLQGQKDFPQSIMLKRQRDLQDAMEKGLAFRHEADSLLRAAEDDMVRPVRKMLSDAIAAVGEERGYECVVDASRGAVPWTRPSLTEDATPFVLARLNAMRGH